MRTVTYDGTYEDLFFYIDRLIIAACGADVAGRLHTARSRNDIAMTTYRMRQRECLLELIAATLELRRSLLGLVARHHDTVFAVHTHTQRAQPTTVAHYLLAVVEQVERDAIRLKGAFDRTNLNPLGACAITGTGFNIDRDAHVGPPRLLGAHRQHLRQHCDRRLSARERLRSDGPRHRHGSFRSGSAPLVHG